MGLNLARRERVEGQLGWERLRRKEKKLGGGGVE